MVQSMQTMHWENPTAQEIGFIIFCKVSYFNKLNWDQYLDLNGVQACKESINYFPTNFLLDQEGKIIRKNIALEELERILEQISESDK